MGLYNLVSQAHFRILKIDAPFTFLAAIRKPTEVNIHLTLLSSLDYLRHSQILNCLTLEGAYITINQSGPMGYIVPGPLSKTCVKMFFFAKLCLSPIGLECYSVLHLHT